MRQTDKQMQVGSIITGNSMLGVRLQPSRLVQCQKYNRKHKGAVKMCMARSLENAYCVNRNVTEMYVNCGSWNACYSIYKVEIISLASKSLIVLR